MRDTTEGLDDETEARIQEHAYSYNVIGLDRRSHARQIAATDALRSRILELQAEARAGGMQSQAYVGFTAALSTKLND